MSKNRKNRRQHIRMAVKQAATVQAKTTWRTANGVLLDTVAEHADAGDVVATNKLMEAVMMIGIPRAEVESAGSWKAVVELINKATPAFLRQHHIGPDQSVMLTPVPVEPEPLQATPTSDRHRIDLDTLFGLFDAAALWLGTLAKRDRSTETDLKELAEQDEDTWTYLNMLFTPDGTVCKEEAMLRIVMARLYSVAGWLGPEFERSVIKQGFDWKDRQPAR